MKLPALKNFVVSTVVIYLWVMAARLMFIGPPSAAGALMALIPCSLLAFVGLLVAPVSRQPVHAANKQSPQPVRQLTGLKLWLGRIWFGACFDERWAAAQREGRQWPFGNSNSWADGDARRRRHRGAQPVLNANGLPMAGSYDISGNPYGSTGRMPSHRWTQL